MLPISKRTKQWQAAEKGGLSCCIGRTKGGLKSKPHAVCNASGQPMAFHLTGGQVCDYKDAAILLNSLPKAKEF